ncbi:MAG: HAD-IB family hydrolase [Nitrospinota bacterium]|nr:MAG: HAD-IB family hydrolase [Nitrospinota bacterium]
MSKRNGERRAAFFDVDGTLVQTNVVHYYVYFKWQTLSPLKRVGWACTFLPRLPYYALVDLISRQRFNRLFFQNYQGIAVKDARRWSREILLPLLLKELFPEARRQIQQHQEQGDLVVLVTGSLDFIMEPLRNAIQANALFAARLVENDGFFTGELQGRPISGEEKARLVREYADREGIALEQSYAYGDSIADLPMLQMVGYPVAVNPDRRLRRVAVAARWPILQWQRKG